jgi:alpha-N-arabinofuranosidase
METTTIRLHTAFQIDRVDPRLLGGFLEHMGRAVYEGVYDPGRPTADAAGFRTDVLDALRRMDMTVMRYPGGNFASGYHWLDGVGPRDRRPKVRELAWNSVEPNQFGTDEYVELCRRMGWEPMITVNLGTGTPEEARTWVEYCNAPAGTEYADMRAANGQREPYGVKLWCLGNEMDGPWQMGHVPAEQYARRAQQAAKLMQGVDRTIQFVACGSSGPGMPTFPEWDRQVLEIVGDLADYVSLHRYVGNRDDDTSDYLAVTNAIDRQIEQVDAVCRAVQATRRSEKRTHLCFDEWNVWYKNRQTDGHGQVAPHLIEEVYNLEDALVVAGFMNSFIRHADVVKIANIAQIVNVIAPLQTRGDELLVQSIFYPFEMVSKRRKGVALQLVVDGPTYDSPSYGRIPYVDASAILNDDRLHAFATNRSLEGPAELQIDLADGEILRLESAELLTGPHAKAANSFEQPDVIRSQTFTEAGLDVTIAAGRASLELPPLAVAAMTFVIR